MFFFLLFKAYTWSFIDAVSNPKSLLIKDFVKITKELLEPTTVGHLLSRDFRADGTRPQLVIEDYDSQHEDMDVQDFDDCIRTALSTDYSEEEVRGVLQVVHEYLSPTIPLGLLNVVDCVAIRRGLPSARYVWELRQAPLHTKLRSSYVIDLTPAFYARLLHHVSTLKEDFDMNGVFMRLTRRWASTDTIPASLHWTSVRDRLNRVRNTTISIAKKLLENKALEQSLRSLEKDSAPLYYETRQLPAKWVEYFHRPRANWKTITQEEEKYFSSNCFRCSAIVSVDSQHRSNDDGQANSSIEQELHNVNVERLRFHDETGAVEHYLTEHLNKGEQWRGLTDRRDSIPGSCVSLIPCVLCVQTYLASGREAVDAEDNLFYCCVEDHDYHASAFHSTLPIIRVAETFQRRFHWNRQIVEETQELFEILCLACLEIFASRKERKAHQRQCFLHFASLSRSFGKPLTVDFSSSPYAKQHFLDRLKKATTNQLKQFRDTLARRQEGYTGWPTTTQPMPTQEELRLKIEEMLMPEDDADQFPGYHGQQQRQQGGSRGNRGGARSNRGNRGHRGRGNRGNPSPHHQQQQGPNDYKARLVRPQQQQQQQHPQQYPPQPQHSLRPFLRPSFSSSSALVPLPPRKPPPGFTGKGDPPRAFPRSSLQRPPPPLFPPPVPSPTISPPLPNPLAYPISNPLQLPRLSPVDIRMPIFTIPPPAPPSAALPLPAPALAGTGSRDSKIVQMNRRLETYRRGRASLSSASASSSMGPTLAGAATFQQSLSLRTNLPSPSDSEPFEHSFQPPFIKSENSIWQRSSHLHKIQQETVTFSIDEPDDEPDEPLFAQDLSLRKRKIP